MIDSCFNNKHQKTNSHPQSSSFDCSLLPILLQISICLFLIHFIQLYPHLHHVI